MSASFHFDAPDHFTAGGAGPPGQRVFYLQARQNGQLVALKCEKEQVRALGGYLAEILTKTAAAGVDAPASELIDPVEAAWTVAVLGAGYDEGDDRVVLEAHELVEEEADEE